VCVARRRRGASAAGRWPTRHALSDRRPEWLWCGWCGWRLRSQRCPAGRRPRREQRLRRLVRGGGAELLAGLPQQRIRRLVRGGGAELVALLRQLAAKMPGLGAGAISELQRGSSSD
jgi:hypothetical protein